MSRIVIKINKYVFQDTFSTSKNQMYLRVPIDIISTIYKLVDRLKFIGTLISV